MSLLTELEEKTLGPCFYKYAAPDGACLGYLVLAVDPGHHPLFLRFLSIVHSPIFGGR
jgi:hypothetical protein